MFLKEHILNHHIKFESQLTKPWLHCMMNFSEYRLVNSRYGKV